MRRVGDAVTTCAQQARHHVRHGRIVFDQQDIERADLPGRRNGRRLLRERGLRVGDGAQRGQVDGETRTLARRAVHVDAPPHGDRQFLADRQAQSTAAVVRRGLRPFGLLEATEQPRLLFGIDARPAVADGQPHALGRQRHGLQGHVAGLGELDRIAQQVEQDLPQPQRIAAHPARHAGGDAVMERQPALARHRPHQRGDIVQQRMQVELDLLQLQLAGFDLGQVQRIVDQAQQMRAGALDGVGITLLPLVQRRGLQQFGHAQHAGHGRADLMAQRGQETGLGQ